MKGIRFENVSKYYEEGDRTFTALNKVSISVEPGEFVAVIGPSGSGKSTFLSIAGALLKPSEGNVIINGTNLSNLKPKELSKLRLEEIGFIFQNSNLVPYLTVLDQLLVVKKMKGPITSEDKQYAKELLEKVGLGDKLKNYPDQLSGGERQRTAIARALVNDPSIILADEPTASLDTQRAFEIVELMSHLLKSRNKSIIMVTHDERLLKYCDRVYQMIDGNLTLLEKQYPVVK
ncbi:MULTISPECIES: ABC transporter ATP-binding protein [unclassified Geobacillus]|uniref:ABC transporter ATP-binding protein n=1 Tax=unclassified Geobacillus TaxID=2642459 RepID=UPI000BE46E2E|nr:MULTISPECIES: ABC transporter ATP-binding protein [unclassified Geobacillus]PDM38844.1 hemin ABC transporter ATP-binding protein [Parageobacillus yumthangensis]PUF86857.1 ABC transporter ATP-binding protein [Geobacillus sp. LYN3]TXK86465.1 ABC transporter ATP-binding protein [Geobacillus sp. AYS3]TXK91536.1 ABC transporter ATP-binding protein [Parageobacillus sp. SY1]